MITDNRCHVPKLTRVDLLQEKVTVISLGSNVAFSCSERRRSAERLNRQRLRAANCPANSACSCVASPFFSVAFRNWRSRSQSAFVSSQRPGKN